MWTRFPSQICNTVNLASKNTIVILLRQLVTYWSGINDCSSLKIDDFKAADDWDLFSYWWCNYFLLKYSRQLDCRFKRIIFQPGSDIGLAKFLELLIKNNYIHWEDLGKIKIIANFLDIEWVNLIPAVIA